MLRRICKDESKKQYKLVSLFFLYSDLYNLILGSIQNTQLTFNRQCKPLNNTFIFLSILTLNPNYALLGNQAQRGKYLNYWVEPLNSSSLARGRCTLAVGSWLRNQLKNLTV